MREAGATGLSVAGLLDAWEARGLLPDRAAVERFLAERGRARAAPLAVRALVGIGAFIASLCFLGFLVIAEIVSFDAAGGLLGWGVAMALAAVFMQRARTRLGGTVAQSFLLQVSFFFMAVGKILAVAGFAVGLDSVWAIPAAAALAAGATYQVYPLSLDRFLTPLAASLSLAVLLLWHRSVGEQRELLVGLYYVAHLAVAGLLLASARAPRSSAPVAHALATAMAVVACLLTIRSSATLGILRDGPIDTSWVSGATAAALVALIAWAAGGVAALRREPLAVACAGALTLGLVSAPGVLLAICLAVLGHARGERVLVAMAGLLLPVYLFLYYYSLELTLMHKSGVLVASGLVLLAGAAYLKLRRLDVEA